VKLQHKQAQRYFEAVRREIHFYHAAGFEFSDLYVGGGTPTVLPEQLADTIDLVRGLFHISQISVETNPNHLQQKILDSLHEAGVNRLSVGVQSLDDSLLREMERYQAYGSTAEILQRLKLTQGQFDTFNVDMIFNFPHQTSDSLLAGIERLKELEIDQISVYPLMPAISTQRAMAKQIGMVDFKREFRMYQQIREALKPQYHPDTAWSFSWHPIAAIDEYIVDHDEFVGVGSGSFSYLDGVIYSNSFSINRYIEMTKEGRSGVMASRQLTVSEQVKYLLLMKLFGLSMKKAQARQIFGSAYQRLIRKELALFMWLGVIEETQDEYRLSRDGMYYWVVMMREFCIGVNNLRVQMGSGIIDNSLGRK
jgi:coproporphyrinogen III oxidase-like Fe-S oxidoreductase